MKNWILRTKSKRVIAALLAVVIVFITCFTNIYTSVQASASDDFVMSDFSFKVNGQDVTDGQTLNNGDSFDVRFNWSVPNVSTGDTFDIDMNAKAKGVKFPDTPEGTKLPLKSSGIEAGTYYFKDGILHVELSDKVTAGSEIHGTATFKGVIDIANDDDDVVMQNKVVGFGDVTYTVNIRDPKVKDSYANVEKVAVGQATKDSNGDLIQKYSVKITACDAPISGLSVNDYPGNGLSNIESITMDGVSYASLDTVNTALSGKVLDKDESIVITYNMKVDTDVYNQNPSNQYSNGFTLNYTKKSGDSDNRSAYANVNVNKPSVGKSGVLDADAKTVTWTVTVNYGEMDFPVEADRTAANALAGIVDTLDGYQEYIGDTTLTADMLTDVVWDETNRSVKFSYSTTTLDSAYVDPAGTKVENKIKKTFTKDGESYSYETANSVSTPKQPTSFEKELVSAEPNENYGYDLSWKITATIPTSGTSLAFRETPSNSVYGREHYLYRYIVLETEDQVQHVIVNVQGTEDATAADVDSSIVNATGYLGGILKESIYFTFNPDFVTTHAGEKVYIYTKTYTVGNRSDNDFINTAKFEVDGSVIGEGTDQWRDYNPVLKSGSVDTSDNYKANYEITVKLNNLEDITAGYKLNIKDILPAGMELDGNVSYDVLCFYNAYTQLSLTDPNTYDGIKEPFNFSYSATASELNVDFETNTQLVEWMMKSKESQSADSSQRFVIYLVFKYSLKITDPVEFIKAGESKSYVNNAKITHEGDPIGSAQASVTLTPGKIVSKDADYSQERINQGGYDGVEFTIHINKDKLDLSKDSDYITGYDQMGKQLIMDVDTIKVYDCNGATDRLLSREQGDYSFTYDVNEGRTVFTLPDETHIKIVYDAQVNLYMGDVKDDSTTVGQFKDEGGSNRFWIEDFNPNTGGDQKGVTGSAISSDMTVLNETGSVKLKKFWTNENNMVALNGSKFNVYPATYNSSIGEMTVDKSDTNPLVQKNIEVTENGEKLITGLKFDQIYALEEVYSPSGYSINSELYYFVITGSSGIELPADGSVKQFSTSSLFLYYENQPSTTPDPTFDISFSKVDYADTTKKVANAKLQLYDASNTLVKEWTSSESAVEVITGLKAGDYTIKETSVPAGYLPIENITITIADDGAVTIKGTTDYAAVDASGVVLVKNKQTSVKVSKVDKEDGTKLGGAHLQILKPGDEVFDEWDSTTDIKEIKGLVVGVTYTIRETKAPDGYTEAADKTFTIDKTGKIASGSTVETDADGVILVKNSKVVPDPTYKISIGKVDAANAETKLPGASFTLVDADNNEVASWSSTAELKEIENLKKDVEYTLTENTPPQGYIKAGTIKFKIVNGEISITAGADSVSATADTILVKNKKIPETTYKISIGKVDEANTETKLPGASFTLVDADNNEVASWSSTAELKEIENLKKDVEYTLTENTPPQGYIKAGTIKFKIVDGKISITEGAASVSATDDTILVKNTKETSTPTPGGDDTPTPTPGGDDTPTPTPGGDDPTPTPTPGGGDTTPTPTLTPDGTVPTPTPTKPGATVTPGSGSGSGGNAGGINTNTGSETDVPKTGDNMNVAKLVMLLGSSLLALAYALKKKTED